MELVTATQRKINGSDTAMQNMATGYKMWIEYHFHASLNIYNCGTAELTLCILFLLKLLIFLNFLKPLLHKGFYSLSTSGLKVLTDTNTDLVCDHVSCLQKCQTLSQAGKTWHKLFLPNQSSSPEWKQIQNGVIPCEINWFKYNITSPPIGLQLN
jgi:hypothetical protein